MTRRNVEVILKSSALLALAFAALALLVVYVGGSSDDPPSMAISGAGSGPDSYNSPATPTPGGVSGNDQGRVALKPGSVVRKQFAITGDPSPTAEPLTTSAPIPAGSEDSLLGSEDSRFSVQMPADFGDSAKSSAPPCIPTDTAPVPCKPRDISRFGLFTPDVRGAAYVDAATPGLEDVLEKGLHLAGASPVHIAFRGTARNNSVRCDMRGVARTMEQRETAIRFWLELDKDDPLPSPEEVERRFMDELERIGASYISSAQENFRALARGGLTTSFTFLTCYADYTVHEYLIGSGPSVVIAAYDRMWETRSYDLYVGSHEEGEFGSGYFMSETEYTEQLDIIVAGVEQALMEFWAAAKP